MYKWTDFVYQIEFPDSCDVKQDRYGILAHRSKTFLCTNDYL